MPMTMVPEGADQISEMLQSLGDQAGKVAAQGLYEGAGVMADGIKQGAETIRTEPFHYTVFGTRDPSPEEKAVVLAAGGAGISKFEKNGSEVQTSVGYSNAGYAEMAGRLKPIPKIANAINSGTSFMKKQPFFRQAVNRTKRKAEDAISKTIEERLEEITQSGGK